MKSFKKWFSVLTLILVFFIAGCSSQQNSSNTQGESKDKKEEQKEVTITYAFISDYADATKKAVAKFEEEHPNIHVELREMPANANEYRDLMVTQLSAGSKEIDVFDGGIAWLSEFAHAGYLQELDRFIERDNHDIEKYTPASADAAKYQGTFYGLPRFTDVPLLYYRTDLVSEEEVPETWDELVEVAGKVQKEGNVKFGYALQGFQYEGLIMNSVEFIKSHGGEIVDADGKVVINSPDTVQGLQKLIDIATSDLVPANTNSFKEQETLNAFVNGEVAFVRNWPYMYAVANDETKSKIAGKVGVAPMPAGDDKHAGAMGGWNTLMNSNTEHPNESWELLKYITGEVGQKFGAIENSLAPTIVSLYEEKEVQEANPLFATEAMVTAIKTAVGRPLYPIYSEISDIMQIQISKAIAGEITAEEAAAEMQKQIEEVMADM